MSRIRRVTRVEHEVTLADGAPYKVVPLSLSEIKDVQEKLVGLEKVNPEADLESMPEVMDKLIEICFFILKKGNPTVEQARVGKIISMADVKILLSLGLSGEVPQGIEME